MGNANLTGGLFATRPAVPAVGEMYFASDRGSDGSLSYCIVAGVWVERLFPSASVPAHASSHAVGGSDALAASDVGADPAGSASAALSSAEVYAAALLGSTVASRVVTGDTVASPGEWLFCDASLAPLTVTLPTPSATAPPVHVTKRDATPNTVNIVPSSGTINELSVLSLAFQHDAETLKADGSNWGRF